MVVIGSFKEKKEQRARSSWDGRTQDEAQLCMWQSFVTAEGSSLDALVG